MASTFKVFYQNVFSQLKTTGSIAPSSRYLTRAMIQMVQPKDEPLTVLEAGPGTGPFTLPLLHGLGDEDTLDLCELNDQFVEHIKVLLEADPVYQKRKERVHIHHKPVQELEGENRYDFIVSSLPFNNFEPALIEDILQNYLRMVKPGGLLSFFEYAYCRNMKWVIADANERERMKQVAEVIQTFLDRYVIDKKMVFLNFPPARVYINRLP